MYFRVVLCLCICMLESTYGDHGIYQDHSNTVRSNKLLRDPLDQSSYENFDDNYVNLTLYYETLCPACRDFFATQLAPNVEQLRSYLKVELIPYGNARTFEQDGRYAFRCQHGKKECYGNKLQACVIDNIQDSYDAIMFNACLMRLGSTEAALENCGQSLNQKTDTITNSSKSTETKAMP